MKAYLGMPPSLYRCLSAAVVVVPWRYLRTNMDRKAGLEMAFSGDLEVESSALPAAIESAPKPLSRVVVQLQVCKKVVCLRCKKFRF
jgi:hypothetical protein